MNKLYWKAPLVLGLICVGSAGIIGGVHAAAAEYARTHKSTEAPKYIKSLKEGATFEEVAGFTPTVGVGENGKITISEVYECKVNGTRTGFAYKLNCGKPMSTEVVISVLYEGEVEESTLSTLKPTKVGIISVGDAGNYTKLPTQYIDGINDGSIDFNGGNYVGTGASSSQKCIRDGLIVARKDYLVRHKGGGPAPVDEVKEAIKGIYSDVLEYNADSFEAIDSDSFSIKDGTGSYTISKRYTVTREDMSKVKVYVGTANSIFVDYEGEQQNLSATIYVGWSCTGAESELKPDGITVDSNSMSFNEWKDVYVPGIISGSKSLDSTTDVNTGATNSSESVRQLLLGMRHDYAVVLEEEAKAKAEAPFREIYGESFISFVEDEFTATTSAEYTIANGKGTHTISKRYTVTLTGGKSAKVYLGTGNGHFWTDEDYEDLHATVYVGWSTSGASASEIKPDGYSIAENTFSYSDWKGYMNGLFDGSKTLESDTDVKTGATNSAQLMQHLLTDMRADYFSTLA